MRLFTQNYLFTAFIPALAIAAPTADLCQHGQVQGLMAEERDASRAVIIDPFKDKSGVQIAITGQNLEVKGAILEPDEQISAAAAQATSGSKQEETLNTARKLRLQGRFSEAGDTYAQFITKYPGSSRLFEARFWLAKCIMSDQKWDEAAAGFTEFLKHHSDQRVYSQQAKEDRIYCWKVRQKQNPKALPGLKAALTDSDVNIRVQAALALSENKDASGKKALEEGLGQARFSEQCALALWKLGLRPEPKSLEAQASWARTLIVKVKTDNPDDSFEMKIPVKFFKGLEIMLPDEAKKEMASKGLSDLTDLAATAPKGTVLFQFKGDGGKTSVVISVD